MQSVRRCDTCEQPRSSTSFACHYDSHSEICHACKDFCIHRVKLATSKGITVHELFAAETDAPRLRRYQALTRAGVVWEQVARRQHLTRGKGGKRRARSRQSSRKRKRSSTPMSSASPVPQSLQKTSAEMDVSARRVSSRPRRKPTTMLEYDDASSVSSHSSGESVGSADSTPSSGSQTAHHATLDLDSLDFDFDAAVDAIVGSNDLGASEAFSVDDLEYVMHLDSASPPMFTDAVTSMPQLFAETPYWAHGTSLVERAF